MKNKNRIYIFMIFIVSVLGFPMHSFSMEEFLLDGFETENKFKRMEANSIEEIYTGSILKKITAKYKELRSNDRLRPIRGYIRLSISLYPDGKLDRVVISPKNIDDDIKMEISALIEGASPFGIVPSGLVEPIGILNVSYMFRFEVD